MLTINLLPRKRPRPSAIARMDVRTALSTMVASVRDPLLIGAIAAVVVSGVVVGWLQVGQQKRFDAITADVDRAVRDSTRYSNVLAARRRVLAERDSVSRRLGVIRAIDNTRYRWAHLLDEISRAVPSFTWLTTVEQTSVPPQPPGTDSTARAGADSSSAGDGAARDGASPSAPPVRFRIVGRTVDIQAMTLFMRQLESSPFMQSVTLVRSAIVAVDGKDVTEFELVAESEQPPLGEVRTVPVVIPVR